MSQEIDQSKRDLVILREVYLKFFDIKSRLEKVVEEAEEYYQKVEEGRRMYFSDYDQELSYEELPPFYVKEVDEAISYEIERLREFIGDMKKYRERAERITGFIFKLEDKLIKGKYDVSFFGWAGINIRIKGGIVEVYYEFDNNILYHGYINEVWEKSFAEILDSVVNLATLKYMIGSLMDAMNYCCIGKNRFKVVEEIQSALKEVYDMIP